MRRRHLLALITLALASCGPTRERAVDPAVADETAQGSAIPETMTVDSGLVIMHGRVLDPPYAISIVGGVRTINGEKAVIKQVLAIDPPRRPNPPHSGRRITTEELECHRVCVAEMRRLYSEGVGPEEMQSQLVRLFRQDSNVADIETTGHTIRVTYGSGITRLYTCAKREPPKRSQSAEPAMSLDQVWQHSVVLGLRVDGLVVVVSNGQHAVVPGGDRRRAAIDAVSEACENADIEFLRRRFGIPTEEAELILDRFVKP